MKISYEALGKDGRPYIREARTIHELPTPADRLAAMTAATLAVAKVLRVPPPARPIGFGEPVWRAVGFTSVRHTQGHPSEKLLTTMGQDIPLSFAA